MNRLAPVLLAALLGAPSAPLAAQEAGPGIPVELALVLAGGSGLGEIHVGALPAQLAGVVPLEGGGRLLGTYSAPHGWATVVFAVERDPGDAVLGYERALDAAGWTRAALPPGVRSGGFQSSGPVPSVRVWCAGGRSLDLMPMDAGERTFLRVGVRAAEHTLCDEEAGTARMERTAAFERLPALFPPEGARVRGGGVGGSPTSLHSDAPIQTELSVSGLIEHFDGQLLEAGWVPIDRLGEGDAGLSRYRVRDDDGRAWIGVLALWRLSDGAVHAHLRMDRVDLDLLREPGSPSDDGA